VVKPGALLAARATGALLIPMGSAISRGVSLRRAWDRFAIAWPFSRVAVVLGAPIDPTDDHARERLERAIADVNVAAARELAPSHALVERST
jgi:lysophospholipid acyltransferase (LPLAT)-like uncharacterized protein